MRRRDYIFISLFLLLTIGLAVQVTSIALLNRSLLTLPSFDFGGKEYATQSCGTGNKIEGLADSSEAQLRKLDEYQQVCETFPATKVMLFTDMPNSDANAKDMAAKMATKLKEFDKYKILPLVIMEPVTDWGFVDFKEFRTGFYDAWLDAYFAALKQQGITDEQMGMWVPFPEANLPYWNHQNSKPDDFAANVTKIVSIQKRHFPKSQASVMLNSATYETDDFEWSRGDYLSLVPYLKDIPKGLIDSFGYQGLPWLPAANQVGGGVVDANQYLNNELAQEAADALGIKSIWFNTGTFGRKYTLDASRAITVKPELRKDILSGVLVQAKKLQDNGYAVAVNLFSEDKSADQESTDWSYWPAKQPKSTADSTVFADFAAELRSNKVDLWLFDK